MSRQASIQRNLFTFSKINVSWVVGCMVISNTGYILVIFEFQLTVCKIGMHHVYTLCNNYISVLQTFCFCTIGTVRCCMASYFSKFSKVSV